MSQIRYQGNIPLENTKYHPTHASHQFSTQSTFPLKISPPKSHRWVHEANNELEGRVSLLDDDLDDLESESDEELLPPPRPRSDPPENTRNTSRYELIEREGDEGFIQYVELCERGREKGSVSEVKKMYLD